MPDLDLLTVFPTYCSNKENKHSCAMHFAKFTIYIIISTMLDTFLCCHVACTPSSSVITLPVPSFHS